jgi:hypothetical protein
MTRTPSGIKIIKARPQYKVDSNSEAHSTARPQVAAGMPAKERTPPTAGMTATVGTSVTEEMETAEKMLATTRRKQN